MTRAAPPTRPVGESKAPNGVPAGGVGTVASAVASSGFPPPPATLIAYTQIRWAPGATPSIAWVNPCAAPRTRVQR